MIAGDPRPSINTTQTYRSLVCPKEIIILQPKRFIQTSDKPHTWNDIGRCGKYKYTGTRKRKIRSLLYRWLSGTRFNSPRRKHDNINTVVFSKPVEVCPEQLNRNDQEISLISHTQNRVYYISLGLWGGIRRKLCVQVARTYRYNCVNTRLSYPAERTRLRVCSVYINIIYCSMCIEVQYKNGGRYKFLRLGIELRSDFKLG